MILFPEEVQDSVYYFTRSESGRLPIGESDLVGDATLDANEMRDCKYGHYGLPE